MLHPWSGIHNTGERLLTFRYGSKAGADEKACAERGSRFNPAELRFHLAHPGTLLRNLDELLVPADDPPLLGGNGREPELLGERQQPLVAGLGLEGSIQQLHCVATKHRVLDQAEDDLLEVDGPGDLIKALIEGEADHPRQPGSVKLAP